jgi:hypothetical protein
MQGTVIHNDRRIAKSAGLNFAKEERISRDIDTDKV